MKEITINRNSWHYWFADLRRGGADTTDFCSYIGSVTGGLFTCALLIALIGIFSALCGNFFAWLAALIVYGWVTPDNSTSGVLFMLCVATLVGLVYLLVKGTKAATRESEFIQASYASLKDKVCFKVRVE